ncbi:hypothetical protein [Agromyces sp. Soil535]|uniref:hypothetical protein n=1 Tax=Agromyces sp. Soil535 TaxID=1736390 RepID=UPI000A8C4565|nr:hypothetical protein [Agromyces sp. Soil535]
MSVDAAATRHRTPSPRSAARPMAFTFGEFARGALGAWGWFLLMSILGLAIAPVISAWETGITWGYDDWLDDIGFTIFMWVIYGGMFVLAWSMGALFLGAPLAYLLGFLLRTVPGIRIHLVAFTLFGIGVGIAVAWTTPFPSGLLPWPTTATPFLLAAGIAIPLGWHRTARRALEDDAAATRSVCIAPALPED